MLLQFHVVRFSDQMQHVYGLVERELFLSVVFQQGMLVFNCLCILCKLLLTHVIQVSAASTSSC